MELENVKIYRMTHIKNIPHILRYGITHKNSPNANPNFVQIGDTSLISTRNNKIVWIDNGDIFDPDIISINLGDFIPFYFGTKMPMLYVIQHGYNFVEKPSPPEDIIYLVCSLKTIFDNGFTFYFSDKHATANNFASFYDKNHFADLPELLDWEAIKAPYWGGEENLDLKLKKQAECLVKEDISPEFLLGFGCYNEKAKNKLVSLGVQEDKIKIIPNHYF